MGVDEFVDWRNLQEFAGVDLSKSFVLSWQAAGETVSIDVDLFLTPEHTFYEKPRPAEKVCIRPAVIEFPYCETIKIGDMEEVELRESRVSSLRAGAITELRRMPSGAYEIIGGFGRVRVKSERPVIRINPA